MTTLWVWGTGWVTATLVSRQRAPGLDRCGYYGGSAPEVRGRLFLPMVGPWWLGRAACRPPEVRRAGWLVRERPPMSLRPGAFYAVGDGNPVPERVGCPRLERTAPGRVECPPPASGVRSSVVAAEARDPCQSLRSPVGRRSGARLEDVERERSPSPSKIHK